jgi:hypothetical protein
VRPNAPAGTPAAIDPIPTRKVLGSKRGSGVYSNPAPWFVDQQLIRGSVASARSTTASLKVTKTALEHGCESSCVASLASGRLLPFGFFEVRALEVGAF